MTYFHKYIRLFNLSVFIRDDFMNNTYIFRLISSVDFPAYTGNNFQMTIKKLKPDFSIKKKNLCHILYTLGMVNKQHLNHIN